MIVPFLSNDAFLADVMATRDDRSDAFRLWWLGQSGFLLQYRGRHLLMDPYLSDSLTAKYAHSEKPHVRMTRRVIDPARLNFIDAVTSSHHHTDHLDPPTLRAVAAANPNMPIFVPAAHVELAAERADVEKTRLVPTNDGDQFIVACGSDHPGFELEPLPAAHETLEQDAAGNHKYLGYVISFGGHTIYHSGDTIVYPGLSDRLRPHHIDVALLPINGKVGNMGGAAAAQLAKGIGARFVIPCHYDMFEFNTADPRAEFVPTCERLGQPYRLLRAGERLDSSQLPAKGKSV